MSRQIAIGLTLVLLGVVLMGQSARADELLTTLYGDGTDGYMGQLTASGSVCCPGYTAATNAFPMGTALEVCFGGACTSVVVDDRCGGCGLDLAPAPAADIGIDLYGPAVTEVTVL